MSIRDPHEPGGARESADRDPTRREREAPGPSPGESKLRGWISAAHQGTPSPAGSPAADSAPLARALLATGAFLGFVGVALGAFGAHVLEGKLDPKSLAHFETAVQYHLIHTVLIVIAALAVGRTGARFWSTAGWLFAAGVVLFSGSLYLLVGTGSKVFGPVTPIGGLCFLAGWLWLLLGAWRGK